MAGRCVVFLSHSRHAAALHSYARGPSLCGGGCSWQGEEEADYDEVRPALGKWLDYKAAAPARRFEPRLWEAADQEAPQEQQALPRFVRGDAPPLAPAFLLAQGFRAAAQRAAGGRLPEEQQFTDLMLSDGAASLLPAFLPPAAAAVAKGAPPRPGFWGESDNPPPPPPPPTRSQSVRARSRLESIVDLATDAYAAAAAEAPLLDTRSLVAQRNGARSQPARCACCCSLC